MTKEYHLPKKRERRKYVNKTSQSGFHTVGGGFTPGMNLTRGDIPHQLGK
jgi:hypothetical protein